MPSRVYVCSIIGAGTQNDPQRPALADAASVTGWSAAIATLPNGIKKFGWSVCRVESTGFAGVDDVATQVPTAALDVVLPAAALTAIRTRGPVADVPLAGPAREGIPPPLQ